MAVIRSLAICADMPGWKIWFAIARVADSGMLVFLRMRKRENAPPYRPLSFDDSHKG
jgi:hypothetical protein